MFLMLVRSQNYVNFSAKLTRFNNHVVSHDYEIRLMSCKRSWCLKVLIGIVGYALPTLDQLLHNMNGWSQMLCNASHWIHEMNPPQTPQLKFHGAMLLLFPYLYFMFFCFIISKSLIACKVVHTNLHCSPLATISFLHPHTICLDQRVTEALIWKFIAQAHWKFDGGSLQ